LGVLILIFSHLDFRIHGNSPRFNIAQERVWHHRPWNLARSAGATNLRLLAGFYIKPIEWFGARLRAAPKLNWMVWCALARDRR
jgi:hypothetical protein